MNISRIAGKVIAVPVFVFLSALAGHAGADEPGKPKPTPLENAYEKARGDALDAYIAGRLITAYVLSEHLSPFAVGVNVRNGVIRLSGTVENNVQRDLAIEIARGVPQASDVNSEIQVQARTPRKEPGAQESFAQNFSDAGVTARVKSRLLWNGSTSGLAINVDTERHIVTLSGTVQSGAESALAEQIALNTKGVEDVENNLSVAKDVAKAG